MKRRTAFFLVGFALSRFAAAQTTRSERIEQQRREVFRSPYSGDSDPIERGIIWLNDHGVFDILSYGYKGFIPVIGGTVNGSGLGLGLEYRRRDLLDGKLLFRTSARFTTRDYQVYDLEVAMPRLARKAYVDFYSRHRNYAEINYYGPGPRSRKTGRSDYRLEDTTADLAIGLRPIPQFRLGVVGGYLATNVGSGQDDRLASTERVYSDQQAPGIKLQTNHFRGGFLAEWDSRHDSGRRGGKYYARYDFYRDVEDRGFSFRRLTAEGQHYIPFFNEKRTIALRARTVLSYPEGGQRVPFYLQPSLGASDDLRGFRRFRFYDDNSLVVNGEYRWEIYNGVDAALFADGGKVFPRPGLLNFSRLEGSFGAGLRFRAPGALGSSVRLDVGISREGAQIWFVFNDVFTSPQIRNGNQLAPPPGRLP